MVRREAILSTHQYKNNRTEDLNYKTEYSVYSYAGHRKQCLPEIFLLPEISDAEIFR